MPPTKEFTPAQMTFLRGGDGTVERDPVTAIGCILSIDPSGGGLVSAIGIVGLYVYKHEGALHYEIAHAVAVSVDIKTYLFAIADLIHAHAAALLAASNRQPVVYIESIDRVSYTGHLFNYMYPTAPFGPVRETVFFDKESKRERFDVVKGAIDEGRLRIRSDLKRFIRPKSWANYLGVITNLSDRGDVDWQFNVRTATGENVRLLEEMERLPQLQSPKKYKQMDDVVLAMVNGIYCASQDYA
jgi:hypothetical protein